MFLILQQITNEFIYESSNINNNFLLEKNRKKTEYRLQPLPITLLLSLHLHDANILDITDNNCSFSHAAATLSLSFSCLLTWFSL